MQQQQVQYQHQQQEQQLQQQQQLHLNQLQKGKYQQYQQNNFLLRQRVDQRQVQQQQQQQLQRQLQAARNDNSYNDNNMNNNYRNGSRNRNNDDHSQRKVVYGSKPAGEGDLIGAPPPKRYLFVSRLNRAMETEFVRSNLTSKNINVLEIEKMSHDYAKFNSYKIGVSIDDYYKLLNDKFWSSGIKCEKWRNRGNSNYDNQYVNDESYFNNDRWDAESYFRNGY